MTTDTRTFACAYCWRTETGTVTDIFARTSPDACPSNPKGLGMHLWMLIPLTHSDGRAT